MLDDMFNSHPHLRLIIRHEVIFKETNKGTSSEIAAEETAFFKKMCTCIVYFILVCLRYLASFSSFERNFKLDDIIKYGKFTMLGAYFLAANTRRVIKVKVGDKI